MESNTYQVRNRDFERFLYAHEIDFLSSHYDPDGTCVWVYEDNDYFRHVLQEWMIVLDRKALRRKGRKE